MLRHGLSAGIVLVLLAITSVAGVIYVDDDAPPGGNGQSWTTAFAFLQDALAVAQAGDEIRVADGVYYPDRDAAHPIGTGDRYVSFILVSEVAIYGGYAGLSLPTNPDQRDLALYASTLSGNIGSPTNAFDNSRHVIAASGTAQGTLLDSLVITEGSGRCELHQPATSGMGLYLSSAVLTLRTCSITNNDGGSNAGWGGSADGAGIYCVASSVDLLDCTIANNAAGDGSDEFAGDRPLFDPFGELRVPESSVVPADGYPGGNGGGIDATGNSLVRAFSCRLLDNRSGNGGYASNPNLGGHGGLGAGICLDTSSRLEAFNCQICGGRTGNGGATWLGIGGDGGNGAGIYVGASSSLYATNCLIAGNRCEWRLKSAAPGGLPTVG